MAYCKIDIDYEEPTDGNKRIIFALDPIDPQFEKTNCRLQLIPGRVLELSKVDAFNAMALGGHVAEMCLDSGHTCYVVDLADQVATTRMMIPSGGDDTEKIRRFIPLADPPVFDYNSKFPVVVYLPEDAELRYSVWTGSDEVTAHEE